MKKTTILLVLLCAFAGNIQAQLFKKLKDKVETRSKNRVEQKVETKVNETTDKAVDKTIDPVLNPTLPKKKTAKTPADETTKKEKKQTTATTKSTKEIYLENTLAKYYTPIKAINFNTATPVNVPNAWGHWKDADGNRYGFSADIDLFPFIYKVTAEGKTFLYYKDRDDKGKSNGNFPISKEPIMDANANFYFENMGFSIKRLTKDGIIETVAGNPNSEKTIADGKGSAAKMVQIEKMKLCNDGNIYFTEEINDQTKFEDYTGEINLSDNYARPTIIRKMTPDGTVTTLKDKNNNIFIVGNTSDIELDKEGNIIIASGYIFKLTPGGEKVKLIGTQDPYGNSQMSGGSKQRWVMGDTTKAKVPGPWKLIYNNKGELIIWDYIVQRFAKFDGKTVTAFTGTSDMGKFNKNMSGGAEVLVDKDGNTTTAQFMSVEVLSVEDEDVYVMTYNHYSMKYLDRNLSIRKIGKDGTVKTIMSTTTNKFFGK